jgi:hypothetical protein
MKLMTIFSGAVGLFLKLAPNVRGLCVRAGFLAQMMI